MSKTPIRHDAPTGEEIEDQQGIDFQHETRAQKSRHETSTNAQLRADIDALTKRLKLFEKAVYVDRRMDPGEWEAYLARLKGDRTCQTSR